MSVAAAPRRPPVTRGSEAVFTSPLHSPCLLASVVARQLWRLRLLLRLVSAPRALWSLKWYDSSWCQLLLWCLGSSDSSSLFSRFFCVVGSREGFVVSLLLLLLRMSCARLQDGPENVEIQCQLSPRFDAYYYVHLHVQGCELSIFMTGFWSCEFWLGFFFFFFFSIPSVFEILWLSPFLMLKIADDRFYL